MQTRTEERTRRDQLVVGTDKREKSARKSKQSICTIVVACGAVVYGRRVFSRTPVCLASSWLYALDSVRSCFASSHQATATSKYGRSGIAEYTSLAGLSAPPRRTDHNQQTGNGHPLPHYHYSASCWITEFDWHTIVADIHTTHRMHSQRAPVDRFASHHE